MRRLGRWAGRKCVGEVIECGMISIPAGEKARNLGGLCCGNVSSALPWFHTNSAAETKNEVAMRVDIAR